MDSLRKNTILLFPDNTLEVVRKTFNIQNREEMVSAVDILDRWIKQQVHFTKKNFSRSYLERLIIRSKGSVERAKGRLDKMCTARTHLPYFFGIHCGVDCEIDLMQDALLPKQTKDYCRVYILRNWRRHFITATDFQQFHRRMIYFLEYYSKHDYNKGLILVADYRELDVMTYLKSIDIVLQQKASTLMFNSYGLCVKSIHIISPSKFIHLVVSMFRQLVSAKIGSRFNVHEKIDSLYDFIERDVLPKDYGGNDLPLADLHDQWLKELSSKDFNEHIKDIDEAKIREELRPSDSASYDFSSLHGTFRRLTVD